MSRGVVILLGVIAAALAFFGVFLSWGMSGMARTRDLKITDIDLTTIADGTYRGSYKCGRFACTVDVQVAGHRIVGLKSVKEQKGCTTSQEIYNAVIAKQTPAIDAVSGATCTTNEYLAAIESALKSAGGR